MDSLIIPANAVSGNPQLVALAEAILADVKSGKITSLACISVSLSGAIECPAYGPKGAELYLGADILKNNIMAAMVNRGSGILRAH